MRLNVIPALVVAALSASAHAQPTVSQRLDSCIAYYQDGEYVKAADSITFLFPLIRERDELTAYKYLGYCYVMLQMTNQAAMVFRSALDRYPGMRVDTLEVPPRIWSFFEEVRASIRASTPASRRATRAVQVSMASLLFAASSMGLWASGYLVASGGDDAAALYGGIGAGVVSVALIPASLSLIVKRDSRRKKRVVLEFTKPLPWTALAATREPDLP